MVPGIQVSFLKPGSICYFISARLPSFERYYKNLIFELWIDRTLLHTVQCLGTSSIPPCGLLMGSFFTWESCCKKQLITKQNFCSEQKGDFSLFSSCWCVLSDYISRMSTYHLLYKWGGDVSEDLKMPVSFLPLGYELPCGSNLWCMLRVPRSTLLNPLR